MNQQIDWQSKVAAQAAVSQALWATHPHLVRSTEGGPLIAAAKNIRIELKAAFPGVKFSVKTSRYSMGNSIDINWTDGPTNDQVSAITCRYEAGSFDGMTDCYNYEHSAWTDAFGEGKYVHTRREYSDAVCDRVTAEVCACLGGLDTIPTGNDYKMGRTWNLKNSGGCDVSREISSALANLSL